MEFLHTCLDAFSKAFLLDSSANGNILCENLVQSSIFETVLNFLLSSLVTNFEANFHSPHSFLNFASIIYNYSPVQEFVYFYR